MPDHPHDDDFDAGTEADAVPTADELAWRAIVDNYGDRVEIDEPQASPPAGPPVAPPVGPVADAPFGGRFGDPRSFASPDDELNDEVRAEVDEDEEAGYDPPEPPPLPTLTPDRGLAWAGVLGSPVVLLVCLILSIAIPTWLGYLLVVGFVGGFVYLVFQMPREPREPWDDGAQV